MRNGVRLGLAVFLVLSGPPVRAGTTGQPVTGCWKQTDLDAEGQRMDVLKRDAQCFTIPKGIRETIEITGAEASCIKIPGAPQCLWIRTSVPDKE